MKRNTAGRNKPAVLAKPVRLAARPARAGASSPVPSTSTLSDSCPVVGIGASAGGLEAFTQLLKHLPADTGMAFVLIQHLDPGHTSFLREALAKSTEMEVSQAEGGTRVEPNHVYVIPPNADIEIHDGRLDLTVRASDSRRAHLPIDTFLRALAAERGSHAIGVVLSGTASDGTDGLRAIKAADGITFAQDPQSAKFPGMPRSAVVAGVVDYCLPLPALAAELVRLSQHPYLAAARLVPPPRDQNLFGKILGLIRTSVGVDFAEYKTPTIERRLARRMALLRADDAEQYFAILDKDPAEVRALCADLLIHVTSFFRDLEAFETLKTKVFPEILRHKVEAAAIRVWVAGCSTGEEVYSLAIALLEHLGDSPRPIQIFGSDVGESAIEKARGGMYPDSALRDMTDERRRRYFSKVEGGYRISKMVRDLCVFVQHDLGRDPPFSKLDLISCRNVLIYFDPILQKRVLARFHYALNQPGYLLLGRAENVSGFGQLFSPIDQVSKVFARSAVASTLRFTRRSEIHPAPKPAAALGLLPHEAAARPVELTKVLDRLLLARYAPSGVLINDKMDILQFRGLTGSYLQPAPGEPQNNILKMARGGLLSTLRATLAKAGKQMTPVRSEAVDVDQGGFSRSCNVVVIPYSDPPAGKDHLYLVLFEEVPAGTAKRRAAVQPLPTSGRRGKPDPRVAKLEHELATTKDYLHSLVDEQGRTNDDLGTANEELVSGNEELQSMNEELETAKEELQSTNEELTTVNDELHSRNQEMVLVNSDLVNVLDTVDTPVLILDLERRIRRYNPNARSILNVLPSDVGRAFSDIRCNLAIGDLDQQIATVIATTTVTETEIQDNAGHWYRMLIRPYRTTDDRIEGAVLSLVDINALKHHVKEAQQARAEAERANRSKDEFLATLSHELRSPLASMLIHAQMLREGGMDDAKLRRAGEAIERSTKVQVQLIEDLLDVSRIVAGKLSLVRTRIRLGTVVAAAVSEVRATAARKSIAIELIDEATVGPISGDAARLQQVVTNLLANAIKFTPAQGCVTVRVDELEGMARLRVSDTGVGIEPAFMPHIFKRFTQEDSSSVRTHTGLGLGLAIVRHLVELHGGTISAASAGKGMGSDFTVMVPLAATLPAAALAVEVRDRAALAVTQARRANVSDVIDAQQLADLRILVIDDDIGNRDALADMLTLRGARTAVAASAEEGMAALDKVLPDVLLCDVAMPGEDGYSFMRRLRGRNADRGGTIPAVALTAFAGEDDRRQALAAGFQLHLTKPVDVESILASIATLRAQTKSAPRSNRRSTRLPA